jgi:hypothetical protein
VASAKATSEATQTGARKGCSLRTHERRQRSSEAISGNP